MSISGKPSSTLIGNLRVQFQLPFFQQRLEQFDDFVDGEGLFFRNSKVAFRDITDGLSQTIAVGERSHRLGEATWTGSVTAALLAGDPSDGVGQAVPQHGSGMVLGHADERHTPGDPLSDTNQFYSRHNAGGVNFLFADGHVSFLSRNMDYIVYLALSTRAGSESVSPHD